MFERAIVILAGAGLLASGAASPALLAQQSAASDATAQRAADARVAELHTRFQRAVANTLRHSARLKEAERLESAAARTDSARSGLILIVSRGDSVSPAQTMAAIRAGTDMAWARIHAYLDSGASFIDGHPLEWRVYSSRATGISGIGSRRNFATFGFPDNIARARQFGRTPAAAEIAATIEDQYGSLAQNFAPPRLMSWAKTSWIPLTPNADSTWQEVAVDLATSRASVARDCFASSIGQCVVALQLDKDSTTDRVHDWYSPADLPSFVSEWAGPDTATRALVRGCADTRAQDECERAARLMQIPQPLPNSAKSSLIAFALERGGRGSFARMFGAKGSAAEVLAATSGLSTEQLLTEWRAKAVAATPSRSMPGALEGVTLLAWTAAFATLAMRRRP